MQKVYALQLMATYHFEIYLYEKKMPSSVNILCI